MAEPTVLVAGATGFIGSALCPYLVQQGYDVRTVTRQDLSNQKINWNGVDAVIHLAGLAHAPGMNAAQAAEAFAADTETTRKLAATAAERGVRRFVFVSTAKAYGREGHIDLDDQYALQKKRAEALLAEVADPGGMDWVVVRPVLVYGPGVKGNLARLMMQIAKGRPLPLGGLDNARSLVARTDLLALLETALREPKAAGQILPAAAADPVSTTEICRALAEGLDVPARLPALPRWCWSLMARLPGLKGLVDRLAGSFVVDPAPTTAATGWQPQQATYAGLVAMAQEFRQDAALQ